MPENYDERRSRCMLDQSSNTQNPVHLVLGSPYLLKTEYADGHEEVARLMEAFNLLAAQDAPPAAEREKLAGDADALSARCAAAHMSALAEHLAFLAQLLRGDYPLRPVLEAPRIHIG